MNDELVQWSSSSEPSTCASELASCAIAATGLESALARVATHDSSFLIVNVQGIATSDLVAAVKAFGAAGGKARLCLTGDRFTLMRVDALGFDNARVGLMMDDVNAKSPFTDLTWDRLDAVRFSADFVESSARDMRMACALRAMLGLSKDLGLCTLAFGAPFGDSNLTGRFEVDYLRSSASSADAHVAYASRRPNC